ncbi:MAG: hypothetical protein IKQ23_09360, partial [Treponema sp.]|nr:hypothetical protein [Treponema sp.]
LLLLLRLQETSKRIIAVNKIHFLIIKNPSFLLQCITSQRQRGKTKIFSFLLTKKLYPAQQSN